MLRKMVIALATIAAVTTVSTFPAWAMHGGGMGRGGFGGGPGLGAHAAVGHPGGFGVVRGMHSFRSHRFGFERRFGFRHRFFRDGFAFIGTPFFYDDEDCISRVWTPWGWRWTSVCY